ncbi:MAG: hypothetical protein Q8P89_03210 [bacterium]|nr:hypothetical protein [bacterium]
MRKEDSQRLEESAPSSLHLFSYCGGELEQLRLQYANGVQLKREFMPAKAALGRLHQESLSRIERLRETDEEIREEAATYMSSMAAGAAYLKMVDELSARGLSSEEIMDFYRKCLKINTQMGTFSWKLRKTAGHQKVIEQGIMTGRREDKFAVLFNHEQGKPPGWFGTDEKRWRDFLVDHAYFCVYLNPELAKVFESRILSSKEENQYLGYTVEHGLPDWFSDINGGLVEKSTVQQEFDDDKEELLKIVQQREKLKEQSAYLRETYNQKLRKAAFRFEEKRRRLLSSTDGFADLAVYLEAVKEIPVYNVQPSEIMILGVDQLIAVESSPDKAREEAIRFFTEDKKITFTKEAVAIWIERQLREGGVVRTAQDRISPKLIDFFVPFLATVENQEEVKSASLNLRQTDKKAFGALNYEIAPFFNILSEDERSYLVELMSAYQGEQIERLIWDMAEIISSRITAEGRNAVFPKQTNITMNHAREFISRWLKNHWRWAYVQIQDRLSGRIPQEVIAVTGSEKIVETIKATTQPINEETREVETTIVQIQRGNLEGWRLRYTFDRRIDSSSSVEIGGITMQEREEAFRQFVARKTIPCSIKPESVIRAFEWLIAVPVQVEQIRIRKDIGGETFKKLKRGAVRIFYSLDPVGKTITFFIHQKKAFNYGF